MRGGARSCPRLGPDTGLTRTAVLSVGGSQGGEPWGGAGSAHTCRWVILQAERPDSAMHPVTLSPSCPSLLCRRC